jgi:hypothetical protein
MSIDYSIYIGPFVRCKVTKKEVERERRTCPNTNCHNHNRQIYAFFCSVCGSKIGRVKYKEEEDVIDYDEVSKKIKHNLVCRINRDKEHIWIGNRIDDQCHLSYDPTELESGYDVCQKWMSEVRSFVAFYVEEIRILRQEYGETDVEVLWGVIHTAS